MLKVFKFGGASIRDAQSLQQLLAILNDHANVSLVVVVSAMGKTTNALENLLALARSGEAEAYKKNFLELEYKHIRICNEAFGEDQDVVVDTIYELLKALDRLMWAHADKEYDLHYDQVICFGELLSSTIVSAYLSHHGVENNLLDARRYIITDSKHRAANVDWNTTQERMAELRLNEGIVLTQGFIASDTSGLSTTLGREGSDYTAAILAYCLGAAEVVIWKDVQGLFNADPRRFPDARQLYAISYAEAIELAYYGATVIHPKTIKPLENRNIPLKVQSFHAPGAKPSLIAQGTEHDGSIPSIIVKSQQALVSINPRDFSFMDEAGLHKLFGLLAGLGIHANLIQVSAISLTLCYDFDIRKHELLVKSLRENYRLRYNTGLELLTIRHYTSELINEMTDGKAVLLEQRSRNTVQLVMKV